MANYTRRSRVNCATGNVLIAAANAGAVIVPADTSHGYVIIGGWVRAKGGKVNEATSVDICSNAATPIVGVAVKKALMTENTVVSFDGATNVTRTTYGDDNLAGKALQLLTVGTDESTCTSVDYCVQYITTGVY
jgi:hypothetical protein